MRRLDRHGVYHEDGPDLRSVPVPAPSPAELQRLVHTIAERVGCSLERAGLIMRDIENAWLAFDPSEEAPIHALIGQSITYRIASGPREGQKVFTLQTLPPDPEHASADVAEASGFSLHAGVSAKGAERDKLEHLARYISRPPIATERLALTEGGHIRYTLKTPYRDGTTHVIFEPKDFFACLAALVPKPRAHLTRYHGVFAPHSAPRDQVVPKPSAGRGPAATAKTEGHRHRAMPWAKRLKRVFAIEIEPCWRCGGRLRVIASIEDKTVIERILDHRRPQRSARPGPREAGATGRAVAAVVTSYDRGRHAQLTGRSGHHLCPASARSVFLSENRSFSGRHPESMPARPRSTHLSIPPIHRYATDEGLLKYLYFSGFDPPNGFGESNVG